MVGSVSLLFLLLCLVFLNPIAGLMGYGEHPWYLGMMLIVLAMDAIQAIPFAYLRYKKRPIKFAGLKLLFIFVSILLNILYFVVMKGDDVGVAFLINLICSFVVMLGLIPEFREFRYCPDRLLMKRMLYYSFPILILGVAGIVNQVGDKIIFPFVYPNKVEADVQLGIYSAATKIAMIMAMMTGCGSSDTAKDTQASTRSETSADSSAAESDYTIGISQFAEHGSLDNCREGFLEGLKSAGIEEGVNLTVEYQNSQADTGTASTIADNFVSKNVNLICAIATPSAMSAYNSCLDSEIPVVYTAVSDPVGAGLADEEGNSVGNITGTSDKLPVEEQLKMIRDLMPDAKKIGILYTTSEANSVSTIKEYKELAENYDFEIVDSGINTVADVEMAAKDLASKVDCISNLTDNTVVSALQTVIAAADEKNIPVFGSEIEQVKSGCLASMGIDYIALGKQTGEMAAKILKGESKAEEMPYEVCSGASLYVNTAVADKLNFELDQATVDGAAEVFDEITVE